MTTTLESSQLEDLLQACHDDPLKLIKFLWPSVRLYDKETEIIQSVETSYETYVQSANMMGKDFSAALVGLTWFLRHRPVKVIATSIADRHMKVLWGEIDVFIRTTALSLTVDRGGPLVYNHYEIRRMMGGVQEQDSYFLGQVAEKGEKFQGHHSPYSLFIGDEASGLEDIVYERAQGWAKRMLIFGNPEPCENFFKKNCKAGDLAV